MVSGTAKIDAGAAGTTGDFRTELGKLDSLFKRHVGDLAKVFSPEEMHTLRMGQKVLEPLKNATIQATSGSGTADKWANMLRLTEAGIRLRYGALRGGSIMRKIKILLDQLPNNAEAVARLVERASFEPDLIQYLLTSKVRDYSYSASNAWVRRFIAAQAVIQPPPGDNTPQ